MDRARLIEHLGRKRNGIAIGVAIAAVAALTSVAKVSLLPPSIHDKPVALSTATTQLLIDSGSSSLGDTRPDVAILGERAQMVSQLIGSPEVIGYIGAAAGIPASKIAVETPLQLNLQRSQQEPTAEKRANQIVQERSVYRLSLDESETLPTITVTARAPSAEASTALANGVWRGLRTYLQNLSKTSGTPVAYDLDVRPLGQAEGSEPGAGPRVQIAMLVFVIVLGLSLGVWYGLRAAFGAPSREPRPRRAKRPTRHVVARRSLP